MRRWRDHVKSDERILGDSDFVQSVLSEQNEQLEVRYRLQSQGYDFRYALARVAQLTGRIRLIRLSKFTQRLSKSGCLL
jgi:putative transposase